MPTASQCGDPRSSSIHAEIDLVKILYKLPQLLWVPFPDRGQGRLTWAFHLQLSLHDHSSSVFLTSYESAVTAAHCKRSVSDQGREGWEHKYLEGALITQQTTKQVLLYGLPSHGLLASFAVPGVSFVLWRPSVQPDPRCLSNSHATILFHLNLGPHCKPDSTCHPEPALAYSFWRYCCCLKFSIIKPWALS